MVKSSLILLLGFMLLLRILSVDFSEDIYSSINISIPFIEDLRGVLIHNATTLLPEKEAGLLLGMVIGVKEEIPWKFNQTLKNTGVVHVVVVSGQNLTLLAGFILGFSPYLGRKIQLYSQWGSFLLSFLNRVSNSRASCFNNVFYGIICKTLWQRRR
jgi:predicted membrane metal-binding protein